MKSLLGVRSLLYFLICLSVVFCFTTSCNGEAGRKNTNHPNGTDVSQEQSSLKIQYPTGSLLPQSILKSKVPTLFNVGKLSENVYGMLLGPSLSTKENYSYEPIGVYTMLRDTVELSFILCKSDQLESELIKADNYNSWSLNEIQYKNLIASWFKTNCELNNCSKMEWANDLKALRILENVD